MRVEEFLGSSRPRYAVKSEIDWRTRTVSGRLRDAHVDADAEVARQVDSEPCLNSTNELCRWSVREREKKKVDEKELDQERERDGVRRDETERECEG
ncbi:hypothetical protein V1478_011704 [Vespula squamosa]|uniref:Uncharacterized protein n=1 Tax=Vespula squamosa TaxID=30214 RepID=A0ABD2AB45_VESSQ